MDNNFLTVKYIFFFTKYFTGCCLEEMFAKNISWPETTIGKVAHLSCKDFFPESDVKSTVKQIFLAAWIFFLLENHSLTTSF